MRYFIRKVSSLSLWQPSKDANSFPSDEHRLKLEHDVTRDRDGSPSYWLAENENDIEKIVSGLILLSQVDKKKLRTFRIVAFEESCFSSGNSNLFLVPDIDKNFPISSMENRHYVLQPTSDRTQYILSKLLGCSGFLKEYRKNPVKKSSRSINSILIDHINDIKDEYKDRVKDLIA